MWISQKISEEAGQNSITLKTNLSSLPLTNLRLRAKWLLNYQIAGKRTLHVNADTTFQTGAVAGSARSYCSPGCITWKYMPTFLPEINHCLKIHGVSTLEKKLPRRLSPTLPSEARKTRHHHTAGPLPPGSLQNDRGTPRRLLCFSLASFPFGSFFF